MVKVIALVAMLSLLILAVGCGDQDDQDVAKRKFPPNQFKEFTNNDVDLDDSTGGGTDEESKIQYNDLYVKNVKKAYINNDTSKPIISVDVCFNNYVKVDYAEASLPITLQEKITNPSDTSFSFEDYLPLTIALNGTSQCQTVGFSLYEGAVTESGSYFVTVLVSLASGYENVDLKESNTQNNSMIAAFDFEALK